MNIKKISEFLEEQGEPKFRLKQIIKAVYDEKIDDFEKINTIPKDLRQKLADNFKILPFDIKEVLGDEKGEAFKVLLELSDKEKIETALLSNSKGDWSACLSTQVGCGMNCAFCATGKGGFKRNLSFEEITDQALFWQIFLAKEKKGKISNIVFMGMGEPFVNYDELSKALKKLTDPETFGFSSRSISVSTCGLAEGIKKFAKDFSQINLAISLVSADDELRNKLMPVNKTDNLAKIKEAIEFYFQKNNRKVFLEYVLLAGVNDSIEEAEKLAKYVKSFQKSSLLHINLIKYNFSGSEFSAPSPEKTHNFKKYLEKEGVSVSIRKSPGKQIKAACGQLAGSGIDKIGI